jgi:hypothetical protein
MQTSSSDSVVACLRRLDFWRAALLLVGKFDASYLAKGIDALLLLPTPALSMAREVFQFIEANVPLLDDDDDDDALQHFKTALAARLLALARVDVARTTREAEQAWLRWSVDIGVQNTCLEPVGLERERQIDCRRRFTNAALARCDGDQMADLGWSISWTLPTGVNGTIGPAAGFGGNW